jgi:hypothetical protein
VTILSKVFCEICRFVTVYDYNYRNSGYSADSVAENFQTIILIYLLSVGVPVFILRKNSVTFSPQTNCIDRATAACQRS